LAHQKTKNYVHSPKQEIPPNWPSYIGERRTTFGKAFGIKERCYGEHVGEHIENLMGTPWELKR
jgi:hypothetical protein